jgi:hypothetical protein
MTLALPESFRIPNGDDLDDLVDFVHSEIEDEGNARLYLGMVRYKRNNSANFNNTTLAPLCRCATFFEQKDEDGSLSDQQHLLANTILSGMIFGHLINECFYPSLNKHYFPYEEIIIKHSLINQQTAQIYDEAGGPTTVEGIRIGMSAMAETVLTIMKKESIMKIQAWSDEVIERKGYRLNFVYGVGLSLYAAKHHYAGILVNKKSDIQRIISTTETDIDQG